MDRNEWPKGPDGKVEDPWSEVGEIVLADQVSGDEYRFSTSSFGGRKAIAKLLNNYVKLAARHPGDMPIVEIGSGSYRHVTYGEVHTPSLKIVGWLSDGISEPEELLSDEIPF